MGTAPFEAFNDSATWAAANGALVPHDSSSNSAERARRRRAFTNATMAERTPENLHGNAHESHQRRPCTGAPSHGWRSLARPGGGHGTRSADGEHPRTSKQANASKVDPTALSTLPTDAGGVDVGSYKSRSGWREVSTVLNCGDGEGGRDGRWNRKKEVALQTAATGFARGDRSTGAVRSRKQPPVVRRLKNTLQALNDSF